MPPLSRAQLRIRFCKPYKAQDAFSHLLDQCMRLPGPLGQPGAHGPSEPIEWELFDLVEDPYEVNNIIDDPAYAETRAELEAELWKKQTAVGDSP